MGSYLQNSKNLVLKKPFEILKQAQVAQVLASFLAQIKSPIPVGISELQIEAAALDFLRKHNCEPVLKGYRNFPSHISISRNSILAHGVPTDYCLQDDDIVSIDIVCRAMGWHADISWTFLVGKCSEETKYLQRAAWNVTRRGVLAARSGNTVNDIAYEVLEEAARLNVFVQTRFAGHGIGREIHELPTIHYEIKDEDTPLIPGMVLCIEPIVSLKAQDAKICENGSYIGTKNVKSAVYEHMVGIFPSKSLLLSHSFLPTQELPRFAM